MSGPRIAHRSAVVAAALAAPAFLPLPDGERSDGKGGDRVEPPQSEQRVTEQADENGGGEVGAEDVLGSLTGGRSLLLTDTVASGRRRVSRVLPSRHA